MIRQLIQNTMEETSIPVESKYASCSWFDDDDESDSEDEVEPIIATMRKRLLSQASEATLDTLGMTESSWEFSDEDEDDEERCVTFSDAVQIFDIESENANCREELFYSSYEIEKFREEYHQELFEAGGFTL